MHSLETSEEGIDEVASELSQSIETSHQSWYIDLKNDAFHYIIFPNKVFKIDFHKRDAYKYAKEYGETLGIPSYQMQFERLKR